MNSQLPVVPTNHIEGAVITNKESVDYDVDRYLHKFREFSLKTSLAIIESAHVVYLAKMSLKADGQYDQFCRAIGRESKSSFIRKFEQIGKQAELFKKYANNLPNTWTSLHILIQLAPEALEDLLKDGTISPEMTGAEIKQLVAEHNPHNVSANKSSTKRYRYKCGVTFDEPLALADQLELDDLIANFIKSKGKACQVATVHAVCSKNTGSEISAEPLAA